MKSKKLVKRKERKLVGIQLQTTKSSNSRLELQVRIVTTRGTYILDRLEHHLECIEI